MSIGIVHLSDIHIKNHDNAVLARHSLIKNAVQSVAHDVSDILLIVTVTGDIAFSGKQDEYVLAAAFLGGLENELRKIAHANFLGTVVIPGNHDCDFTKQETVRSLLMGSIANTFNGGKRAEEDFEQQMLTVQKEFFNFEALVSHEQLLADRLMWIKQFHTSCGKIVVRCLNTAWLSQKEETQTLRFPVSLVSENVPQGDLVVTLFHHPYNWFNPENSRALKRAMETSSDLILTGHEHDGDAYIRTSAGGATTTNYVEGTALQAEGVENGFNFLKLDPQAGAYEIHPFRWNDEMYCTLAVSSMVFARNQALLEHRFINNPEFLSTLDDPGTPFSHPIKKSLRLRDLFVYPDLGITQLQTTSNKMIRSVRGTDVLSFVSEKKKVIISGQSTSGRTSLAKILYGDLQQMHKLVPVLVDGAGFRSVESPKVIAGIQRAFEAQYSSKLSDKFNQLDRASKVVIIDDWHRVKFNLKGKAAILKALERVSDKIILICDDAPVIPQTDEMDAFQSFSEFERCEIKTFGRERRGELITRWHSIGREFEVEEMELATLVSNSENVLDALICKGVVPSFPFYVLSVLQASNRFESPGVPYGSYGHIFESLLAVRMANVSKKNLGQKYTYLSTIAYRMFETSKSSLSLEELNNLHQEYWHAYLFSVDQQSFLNESVSAQILSRAGDQVSFQHKYAYYFFVAKYFQEGIQDGSDAASLSIKLRQLADTAYDDEHARVLIFYLYLVKDRPLIEHILNNASKIFNECTPCDLREDVNFVNELYSCRPMLAEPSIDTRKNREEFRRQQDETSIEETSKNESEGVQRTELSLQVTLAFESIQIMGQVLRNFPGNLKADLKVRLAQESYHLAFRAMKRFLTDLKINALPFRDSLLQHLAETGRFAKRDIEEAENAADKFLIGLSELIIFGIVKKVSSSLGLEDLRDIYQVVRQKAGEEHLPTRLLDLSITLDHLGHLPVEDVKDLEFRVRNNIVVQTILRFLIAQHIALFPIPYKIRQNMVQLFNFQPQPLLLTEKITRRLPGTISTHAS